MGEAQLRTIGGDVANHVVDVALDDKQQQKGRTTRKADESYATGWTSFGAR